MTEWERYWDRVGDEDLRAARDLLELGGNERLHLIALDCFESGELNWGEFANRCAREGLSTTESRFAAIVAGLTTGDPVDIRAMAGLGSCQRAAADVLYRWMVS